MNDRDFGWQFGRPLNQVVWSRNRSDVTHRTHPQTSRDKGADAIEPVAAWQRFLIVALLCQLGSIALMGWLSLFFFLLIWAVVIPAACALGSFMLSGAPGDATFGRMLFAVAAFVPYGNLVGMVVLSRRATRRLKEHGYRVGFFGARRAA